MLIAAALCLFTLLCIALSDDLAWDNVTRSIRNELVFAQRPKDYGAYQLRRDYDRRFLFAFLGALGLIAGGIGAAQLMKLMGTGVIPHPLTKEILVELDQVIEIPKLEPKPAAPNKSNMAPLPTPAPKPSTAPGFVEPVDTMVAVPPEIPADTTGTAVLPVGGGPGVSPGGEPTAGKGGGTGTSLGTGVLNAIDVQRLPAFPGGETAMYKWVQRNVEFPEISANKDRVYVEFVVGSDGTIRSVKAVKGQHQAFMREAERLVGRMPRWTPAQMNGHDVACRLVLPISFETH